MRVFYNKSVSVYRLTAESGSKENYGASPAGTIECAIVAISADDAVLSEGNPASSAVLYCDEAADIKSTDKVVDGSVSYIVKNVKIPNDLLTLSFKRAIIEKMNS